MTTSEQPPQWIDIAAESEIEDGAPKLIRHEKHHLLVVRTEDGIVRAIDNRCPHEGYPLHRGSVRDCVVTCPWHNFKFDLRDGQCLKGDEAARTYPVRCQSGRIWVDTRERDPAQAVEESKARIEEGLRERRLGQIARECTRLIEMKVPAKELAFLAASYDAQHAEWGCSHALPVAIDVLAYLERYPGTSSVLPIMQAMDLASEACVRRPPHDPAAAIDPGDDALAASRNFAEAVEAEDMDRAQGLLRGALARGWGRIQLEPWFSRVVSQHFLNFGHAVIYQSKVFEFLDELGWSRAEQILPGFLRGIVNGTREDTLPRWSWVRELIARHRPQFALWWSAQRTADTTCTELQQALVSGSKEALATTLIASLAGTASWDRICDAFVAAASERLIRFDRAYDADPSVQNGWLDVSHCLSTASALRQVIARSPDHSVLPLLFFVANFIHNTRALDRSSTPIDVDAGPTNLDALIQATYQRNPELSVARARTFLAAAPKPPELARLRHALEDLPLKDQYARPIIAAHALKMVRVAFEETQALAGGPWQNTPLLGVLRFAASPIRERGVEQLVHEARRLVVEGSVPKTLT